MGKRTVGLSAGVVLLGVLAAAGYVRSETPARTQTLLLADGSKVVGEVLRLGGDRVTVETADGREVISADEIIYIAFADWVEMRAFGVQGDTYYNYEFGFSYELPPRSWQVEYRNPVLGVEGGLVEAVETSRALYVTVAGESISVDLEQAKALLTSIYQQSGPDFEMVSETPITVSDMPAVKMVFAFGPADMRFRHQVVVFVTEDKVFRILGSTMEDNYAALEEAMKSRVAAFRLLK
jgi:hypothetical protein